MRIGELNYSGKATKLIAVLMVCILVFTLAIPAQPAEAVAGTTIALAAGLTLAFVAACGVAFTVNEAQNSSTYWEGQIESYLDESGLSDVGEWVDFGSVIYDSASGKLRYPGAVLSGLLDFFSWFTGKNGIEAGGSGSISLSNSYLVTSDGARWKLGSVTTTGNLSPDEFVVGQISVSNDSFESSTWYLTDNIYILFDCSDTDEIVIRTQNGTSGYSYNYSRSSYSQIFLAVSSSGKLCSVAVYASTGNAYCRTLSPESVLCNYIETFDYSASVTAEGTLGMPDIGQKEEELGYVPDVNIPLPETVAADTNIGDINDASTAVLDYAGTAGNTLDLEYEYVEDTNVDTGTDTETGEGTGTDAETGTQTGSLTLENVAADSLVEVAPETMLQDDTLMGLFISKFPWCIPFDLYFAISAFAADPVAPEFEVNLFEGVRWEGLDLSGTEMTLSFEAFEKVAAVTRWSTLIVFCAGLAMITKRMIWS